MARRPDLGAAQEFVMRTLSLAIVAALAVLVSLWLAYPAVSAFEMMVRYHIVDGPLALVIVFEIAVVVLVVLVVRVLVSRARA
ncbi:MAG: hypothetical protein KGM44_08920 [bacterium]|nr:hypothetical protein [bacterium]